ncbi:PREDICTED: uncharacterized protein LOC104777507 isoform X2 [Camelina sativa]|uniref:Uncharacterized protein LOC104777507 isoform X2 n=1 Tax=Camelina sativa TaxID=90675 RepID=A0ABM1RK42_CAMSA|nr:PREDICTED: uncharacterized protein LOC104777507 isoform X2 [Camelina sativa]
MASSSNNIEERMDEYFDQAFDNYFDKEFENRFNQAFSDQQEATMEKPKRSYIERDREDGHRRLWDDYFSDDATYPPRFFRRRFRMNKSLFLRIVERLSAEVPYFRQRQDATGRFGLSALQKSTAAIRMMAYGCAADAVDEYLQLAESTAMLCLEQFVEGVINLFGDEYLRRPTVEDLQRLLAIGEWRGFPGMIDSIDCMHWEWKNCPTAWKGQYTRRSGKPTIVLEAVASQDLSIWHAFFGPPGYCTKNLSKQKLSSQILQKLVDCNLACTPDQEDIRIFFLLSTTSISYKDQDKIVLSLIIPHRSLWNNRMDQIRDRETLVLGMHQTLILSVLESFLPPC